MVAQGIEIRPYQDGDLESVAALQRFVDPDLRCPPKVFADLWKWMYADNPLGPLTVVVAENAAGEILGHEGIMPFVLRVDGSVETGGITCNLIVADTLRDSLLFPRLVKALLKASTRAGFAFGYGPTRPKMLKSMVALGYRDLGPLPVYIRPYNFGKILERYGPSKILATVLAPALELLRYLAVRTRRPRARERVIRVHKFESADRTFFEKSCAQFQVHAVRSPEIANWRFFQPPHREYQVYAAIQRDEMVGYIALRRMSMLGFDSLAIVDILWKLDDNRVLESLLRKAHDQAAESGVAFAACMVSPESPLVTHLKRAGFVRAPEGFNMIVHEPKGTTSKFTSDVLSRWYVTWFDHDYV